MKVRRVEFYPDDWLAGTRGMSDAECGLYWNLCALIYSKGRSVSVGEARRNFSSSWFERLLIKLQGVGKITLNPVENDSQGINDASTIDIQRVNDELTRKQRRRDDAVMAASKRWKNKETEHAAASSSAMPTYLHTTYLHTNKEDSLPNGKGRSPPGRREIALALVEVWKGELGDVLPVPSRINEARVTKAVARFNDEFNHDTGCWREFCQLIHGCPFLTGDNDRQWRADFDWALQPKNILKVREGKYERINGHDQRTLQLSDIAAPDGPPPEVLQWKKEQGWLD